MASTDDIIIGIRADVMQAQKNLSMLKKSITGMDASAFTIAAQAQQALITQTARLKNGFEGIDQIMPRVNAQFKSFNQVMGGINKNIKGVPFAGYAMSIMFFGMAMQRTFQTINKFGVKAFQDVMHSVEGAVTQFDLLNASTTYLGFTLGAALEPLIAYLIPIVEYIADWVSQNEKLAAGILVAGTALGSLLFIGGALKLAIDGFVGAFLLLGPAISGAGAAISAAFGAPLLLIIAAAVAAIILLVAAWQTNFAGFRDFVKRTFGIIWDLIKNVVNDLMMIFGGLFKVLKGLFTGDFQMIWNGLVQIVKGVAKLILDVMAGLGAAIINIFIFAINMVTTVFMNLIRVVVGGIKAAVEVFNKLPGVDISTKGLDKAMAAVDKLKSNVQLGYLGADDVSGAVTTITDMRVFNINIDSSTDSNVVNNLTREIKARSS